MAKKNKPLGAEMVSPHRQDPEIRVSLPPDSKLKSEIKGFSLEKSVTVTARGTVTGYNADKWGCGMTVKIDTLNVDTGMGGDIKRMRKEKTY